MENDAVQRAHWGDFRGLRFAGLARLSTEEAEGEVLPGGTPEQPRWTTGADIKSTEEQEADGCRFVESRGGEYVFTYMEPDTSAWKRKRVRLPDGSAAYRVVRPVYEGALEDLKKGIAPNGERIDGLVVYDIDRLTRDNRHLEDAIEVVQHYKRPILDITGTLDLLTDNGRAMARVVVAIANKSSADTARRLHLNHTKRRRRGIPAGGRRPFGWQEDKRNLHPAEAKLLRDAVKRVILGTGVSTIVAEWNRKEIKSVSGKPWTIQTLKCVLRNPRICGIRSYLASDFDPDTARETRFMAVSYDEEGEPIIGQWEPLVSVAEWEAVVAILGERPARGTGHNSRVYLGTGTLRCGKEGCNRLLRGHKGNRHPSMREFYYACPAKTTGRGCGGVKVKGPESDELIAKLVIAKYEEEATHQQAVKTPQEWPQEARWLNIREDIADLKQARKDRKIGAQRYYADLAEYEAEERDLTKDRNAWTRRMLVGQDKPIDMAKEWHRQGITLAERRAYVEQALTAVVVMPVGKGGRVPLRDRLVPVYAEG
ncbi:recombinase family protein [Streptomyces sp. GMY02]|nr:recombinase family protein [Streptomyces sp. GMY02]